MVANQRCLENLQEVLGYRFRDSERLSLALTHRSGAFEDGEERDNERLEFLGDAVLELVVTQTLFEAFLEAPEGHLTQLRAHVVQAPSLAARARDLDLGSYLRLGKGELASGGADKESILSSALEAVFGAVYLDGGFEHAFRVVSRAVKASLEEILEGRAVRDAKSLLQEWALRELGFLPQYILVDAQGLDHAKTFHVRVKLGETADASGTGKSKKAAERDAAEKLLEIVRQKSR